MTEIKTTAIPRRQKCINNEHPYTSGARDIYDDEKQKSQEQVNKDVDAAILAEKNRAEAVEALHQSEINALNRQNYVTVGSYSGLPYLGAVDTIYRVSNWDGTQVDATKYAEYAWNNTGIDQGEYILLDVKTQVGEVFDISLYKAVGGVLATFADLSAALDGGNNVPAGVRQGGMSVKFVQSSDNKYVQWRLMADEWSTNTEDWSFCGNDVYVENPEFVRVVLDNESKILEATRVDGTKLLPAGVEINKKIDFEGNETTIIENPEFVHVETDREGKILWAIKIDGGIYYGAGVPQQVIDYIEEKISSLSLDEYEDIVAFLSDYLGSDTTLKVMIDSINERIPEIIENPEFLEVTTDSEDKVLEGIRQDGTKVIGGNLNVGGSASISGDIRVLGNMEVSGVSYKVVENSEYLAAWLDAEDKIIFGFKADGKTYIGDADFLNEINDIKSFIKNVTDKNIDWGALSSITAVENPEYIEAKTDSEGKLLAGRTPDGAAFENVGFATPKVSIDGHIIENIEDPEGRSEITTDAEGKVLSYRKKDGTKCESVGIETEKLTLSEEGMTDFQRALKESGFNPGGAGDFSDKDSMYIPEPRLAHFNIIGDVVLESLLKEGVQGAVEGVNYNVPVQVEFCDYKGNYFKKYALLSGQGRSSLGFVKKGLGLDFFNEDPSIPDFDEDNTFSMKFGDWISQDSFHVKSFYTDWPRCTTPIVYKLANEVFRTRGILEDRPYKKYYVDEYSDSADKNTQSDLSHNMETGARCVPDGFPVIVYHNGEFWGVNSWQLKKHRDNYLLSKKKATNIHLDGDTGDRGFGSCFWDWNGTIDWNHYCDDTHGIETRNPKNLYCIDGKKYNADTHNKEIITTAIAEEWIAAGQIIPTGKAIDDELAGYLRTTGKVRKNIEDLTTYVPYIDSLIEGGAATADIKAAIEDRFDINSFIDYTLIQNVVGNWDAWDNNGQLVTWGKLDGSSNLHWSVNVYDCDLSFGVADSDGKLANPANNTKYGIDKPLYKFIWDYYYDELKARYKELRDKGIFDKDHITQLFRDWMNRVGYENYEREFEKWPESPCFRDGNLVYELNPTTGGFYGSIERIYLWIKKRIEFMDAASFFDYNQN